MCLERKSSGLNFYQRRAERKIKCLSAPVPLSSQTASSLLLAEFSAIRQWVQVSLSSFPCSSLAELTNSNKTLFSICYTSEQWLFYSRYDWLLKLLIVTIWRWPFTSVVNVVVQILSSVQFLFSFIHVHRSDYEYIKRGKIRFEPRIKLIHNIYS